MGGARAAVRLALALLALVLAAGATEAAPVSTRLSVVAYHPYPETVPADEGGDPFGFPAVNASGRGVDWMAAYYGAYYYPTARFDGLLEEANRADFNSASYLEAYRARVGTRLTEDTPVSLAVNGSVAAEKASVTITLSSLLDLSAERLVLRVAVVEDDVVFPGKNGVDVHRFLARARFPDQTIAWNRTEAGWLSAVRFDFSPHPTWRAGYLGVVAYVQKEGEASRFEPREVVQAATYMFRQTSPTVQIERGVLLEMYTATWCEACVFGDGAVDILLAELGVPSALPPDSPYSYLRPPTAREAVAALALGLPLAWLVTRRWPS